MIKRSYATSVSSDFWECVNSDGDVISARLCREKTRCFDGFGDQYAHSQDN